MDKTFTILRREQLLIDHAPYGIQSRNPTDSLFRTIPPALPLLEVRLYSPLAQLHGIDKQVPPPEAINTLGQFTVECSF